MSSNISTRKIKLAIAAVIAAAGLGAGATAAVSLSAGAAHPVTHSTAGDPWPAPPTSSPATTG